MSFATWSDAAAAAESALTLMSAGEDRQRAHWLEDVAAAVVGAEDELVGIAADETSIEPSRLHGEVTRTVLQLRMFADVVRDGSHLDVILDSADPAASPPRPDLRRMLVPLGPVAVFSASNFPLAFSVLGGDTASAWAAGCPVVVKAHSGHLRLSERTAEIAMTALKRSHAPDGMLSIVAGRDSGTALVSDSRIKAAAFTGSLTGGRALFDVASARPDPIPFYGELGSVNPVVVTHMAAQRRAESIAAELVQSYTLSAGQLCTKPGLVFVPSTSGIGRLAADHARKAAPARMLTESIADGFAAGWEQWERVPQLDVLVPGSKDPSAGFSPALAAVSIKRFVDSPILREELFGPATLLVHYDSLPEVAEALLLMDGALAAAIHCEEDDDVSGILEVLRSRVGRVVFQGWPTGVAVAWSQHHGGPWPATTSIHTSVGATAIRRFQRPLVYQSAPQSVLPAALRDGNPMGVPRRVDGILRG